MEGAKDFRSEATGIPDFRPGLTLPMHEMHSAMYVTGNNPAKMLTMLALATFPEEAYVTSRDLEGRLTALCDKGDGDGWVPAPPTLLNYCKTFEPAELVSFGTVQNRLSAKISKRTEAVRLTQKGRRIGPVVAGALLSLELQTLESDGPEEVQRFALQTAMGTTLYSKGRIIGAPTRLDIYDLLLQRTEGMAQVELRRELGLSHSGLAMVVQDLCDAGILVNQTNHGESRVFRLLGKASDFQVKSWASPERATVIAAIAALRSEGVVQTTAKDILDRAVRIEPSLARDRMSYLLTRWVRHPPNRYLVEEAKLSSNAYNHTRIFIPDKNRAYLKEVLQIRRLLIEDSTEAEAFRQTARRQAEAILSSPREVSCLLRQSRQNAKSIDRRGEHDWAHDIISLIPPEGIGAIELHRKVVSKYGKNIVYRGFRDRLNRLPDIVITEGVGRSAAVISVAARTAPAVDTSGNIGTAADVIVTARTFPRNWGHDAACRDEDPELFFPLAGPGPVKAEVAKQAEKPKQFATVVR